MVRRVSDEPELLSGPSLSASGAIEGRPEPPRDAPTALPTAQEPPLELDRRPRAAPRAPARALPTTAPSRRWPLVLIVSALLAAGVIAAAAVSTRRRGATPLPTFEPPTALRDHLPVIAGPPVIIVSEPAGAEIRSERGLVGVTPWAGDNPFLLDTPVTLTLPGYAPAKLVVPGAREANLSVTMKRRAR
jgi:hypothetical protein